MLRCLVAACQVSLLFTRRKQLLMEVKAKKREKEEAERHAAAAEELVRRRRRRAGVSWAIWEWVFCRRSGSIWAVRSYLFAPTVYVGLVWCTLGLVFTPPPPSCFPFLSAS